MAILAIIYALSLRRSDKEKYASLFIVFITIGGSIIKGVFVYNIGIIMFFVHCALHLAYFFMSGIAWLLLWCA